MMNQKKVKKARRVWPWYCLVGLLSVMLLFYVAGSGVLTKVVNSKLAELSDYHAEIATVTFNPFLATLTCRGLRVSHSGDNGIDRRGTLGRLTAKVQYLSLLTDEIVIDNVTLLDGDFMFASATKQTNSVASKHRDSAQAAQSSRSVLLRELVIENCSFTYREGASTALRDQLQLNDISGGLTNILITSGVGTAPVKLSGALTARISQFDYERAYVGLRVRGGTIGPRIPTLNVVLRVVGLETLTIPSAIPLGASEMLGGKAADLALDLGIAPDVLTGALNIATIAGHRYTVGLSGEPGDLKMDLTGLPSDVAGRVVRGVGNLAGGLVGAGVETSKTAVRTISVVGKGAVHVVDGFARGVVRIGKGIFTLNFGQVSKGVQDATVGTITDSSGTIVGGASELVDGITGAGKEVLGANQAKIWCNEADQRWKDDWARSETVLLQMPYPPQQTKSFKEE